ncbi:hypothetical protein GGR53DRAFT_470754 [Hypoxylon sp. FL1150]|nr:hypothetical protein GGR53DRAFT_470754 [Hypoxylon sp. FL1150]
MLELCVLTGAKVAPSPSTCLTLWVRNLVLLIVVGLGAETLEHVRYRLIRSSDTVEGQGYGFPVVMMYYTARVNIFHIPLAALAGTNFPQINPELHVSDRVDGAD